MKKTKNFLITAGGVLLFVLGFVFMRFFVKPLWVGNTLPYLCIGIGCGMFGYGLGEMIENNMMKKNPQIARQKRIEMEDERNIGHANAAKAKGYDMMRYVFAALLLAYTLISPKVEIILPFVSAYLFLQFYAVYHRIKLDKEE